MSLDLHSLEAAFASIEQVGKGETTFPVNGIPITLSILLPEQEAEVQHYANQAFADNTEANEAASLFVERFKVALLAQAIVAVGGKDFRNLPYIETGEVLDNGKPVKIARSAALMKIVQKWSGPLRSAIFRQYGDLVLRVELAAEKAITYEPAELDGEIERLEKRLSQLQAERTKRTAAQSTNLFSNQVKQVVEFDSEDQLERDQAVSDALTPSGQAPLSEPKNPPPLQQPTLQVRAPVVPPAGPTPTPSSAVPRATVPTPVPQAPAASTPSPRRPIIPQTGAAPVQRVGSPTAVQQDSAEDAEGHEEHEERLDWLPGVQDSFVDLEGEGRAAVDAENRRLALARQKAQNAQVPQQPEALPQEVVPRRQPPQPAGTVGGIQAYALPPQQMVLHDTTTEHSGPRAEADASGAPLAQINPTHVGGRPNPRFRSPKSF